MVEGESVETQPLHKNVYEIKKPTKTEFEFFIRIPQFNR
jgi:hypothetical protein